MKTPPPAIRLERDVEMRTRDGVVLRADVMRPETEERVPALLCRTPYDKRLRLSAYAHLRAIDAAAAGFAVVFQDVRGRFASDGEWAVMDWGGVERRDGRDAVEWLAAE
ncbi:MAG: CocE/NonD family hydrolase, partial [Candidatus Binatia bacterium]